MAEQAIDTFICVHHRDVGYLLELVLRGYHANFCPKGRLVMITNDVPLLKAFIDQTGLGTEAVLTDDKDWLSHDEQALPGWYRQQLIKLRSYQFCMTPNFCNLGADTVLLQPIEYSDLVDDDFPVLYYTRHRFPNAHLRFEQERVQHVARILQIEPTRAMQYVDFINDLFCFNREALTGLNDYLGSIYGAEPYIQLLKGLDDESDNRNKFGEWTLYSLYLLDILKKDVMMRNSRDGFLYQAHSKLALRMFRFNTKVAHFVGKDFDVDFINRQIARHAPDLLAARTI